MVQKEIWELATTVDERKGKLHFACLEKRLGRQLTSTDLIVAPINNVASLLLKRMEAVVVNLQPSHEQIWVAFTATAIAIKRHIAKLCEEEGLEFSMPRETVVDDLHLYGGTFGKAVQDWCMDQPNAEFHKELDKAGVPSCWVDL